MSNFDIANPFETSIVSEERYKKELLDDIKQQARHITEIEKFPRVEDQQEMLAQYASNIMFWANRYNSL